MSKTKETVETEYQEINRSVDERKETEAYMKRAEDFYNALLDYLMLPREKTAETVVQAAFGAIEFGCIVATQAQIQEEDFKNTVNAIWESIAARRNYDENQDNESSEGEDAVSEEETATVPPTN